MPVSFLFNTEATAWMMGQRRALLRKNTATCVVGIVFKRTPEIVMRLTFYMDAIVIVRLFSTGFNQSSSIAIHGNACFYFWRILWCFVSWYFLDATLLSSSLPTSFTCFNSKVSVLRCADEIEVSISWQTF